MPRPLDGELSRRDKGIRTAEICPTCLSTEIDVEPGYKGGEIVGSRYMCRDCGWTKLFEEDNPEDAAEFHSQVEREIITVDAVTGWLEGFREAAVEELRESDSDDTDQEQLEAQIEMLGNLIDFFEGDSD